MLPSKRFTADFETSTWLDNETYVWCWATAEISDDYPTEWGTDINSFMEWCKCQKTCLIYFHNLKFDGEFIISYLLNNNFKCRNGEKGKSPKSFKTLISDMGVVFSIKVYFNKSDCVTFFDSYKIIPSALEAIPKAFDLPINKLELDYDKIRPEGYIPNDAELDYILNDVKIPAMALSIMFNKGLEKMTQASNAMSDFKSMIGKKVFERFFPILPLKVDTDIRKGYKGGFTFLNPSYASIIVYNGLVLDVNSLYPFVMYTCALPIGTPIFFEGKYVEDSIYPLYMQRITCSFSLKKGKIPTIQIKNSPSFRPTQYLENSKGEVVSLILTNIDLALFFENYDVHELRYVNGWKFRSITGLFKPYIDKWFTEKTKAKEANNSAFTTIAKLMLNSLYGKFGLNPVCRSKTPYLKEGVVKYIINDAEERDPIYIPMAAFITAYAREKTIRTSQKIKDYSLSKYGVDKYIYSDTDSIHTLLSEEELRKICDIDDYKLGAWKIEGRFSKAKFIRQKAYVEMVEKGLKICCAGLPKNCYPQVCFDNFEIGLKVTGKLTYKRVKGGVKLVETTFFIKDNQYIDKFL